LKPHPSWEKVDGWRMLAYKDGERVHLVSRNGRDHTRRFRDIAAAILKLSARSLVLDGEVAIYDQKLRSRFEWLREPGPRRRRLAAALHGVRPPTRRRERR
jgi:ATP-dependent DNA ligase